MPPDIMHTKFMHLPACVIGGTFLANAIPHFVSGLMGRKFPTPFAKPPGKGLSSALVNLIWGWANLVWGYLFINGFGPFDLSNGKDAGLLGLGVLVGSLVCAISFGRLNGGRGPDLS